MTIAIVAGFAVAFALLAVLLVYGERQERRRAGEKLVLAREAFRRGELERALRLIDDAFFVPTLSRYRPEDAQVALDSVRLLAEVLASVQGGAERALEPLAQALDICRVHGGDVPDALTQPVKRYLREASHLLMQLPPSESKGASVSAWTRPLPASPLPMSSVQGGGMSPRPPSVAANRSPSRTTSDELPHVDASQSP